MRKLKLFLACMLMTIFSIGQVWADETVTWAINGVNTTASGGSNVNTTLKTSSITPNTEDGVWTAVANSSYAGTNGGAQFGSGSYTFAGTITLSGTSIPSTATIKSVTLNCTTTGSAYKVNATVAGQDFGSQQTLSGTSATNYTFSGSQVLGESGTIVLTFSNGGKKNVVVKSLSVTYTPAAAGDPYTVSFSTGEGNSTVAAITEASGGAGITLPAGPTPACSPTWTFAGWAEAAVASETTTAPTLLAAGATYNPTDDVTLYAVYKRIEEGGGVTDLSVTEEFSNQTAGTNYQSTINYSADDSNAGIAWTIYYGTVSTNDAVNGNNAQMRWYANAVANKGYVQSTSPISGLQSVSFKARVSNLDVKVAVWYSTDGESWTLNDDNLTLDAAGAGGIKTFTSTINGTVGTNYYIKIGVSSGSTEPSSGNYKLGIDDVQFDYKAAASTTYYLSAPSCSTPACSTPAISGTTPFLGSTEVTITCGTDGAEIRYTTDGSDPTSGSTLYEGAFNITEACTVKAIAIKDGYDNSAVASKAFEKIVPLTTMQAIFDAATATATPTYITFSNAWVVTGVSTNGKNVYISDGTKGMILYNNSANMELAVGNTLSGTVQRSLKLYNGAAELDAFTTEGLTKGTADLPAAQVLDAAGIEALSGVNTGSLVKISGAATQSGTKYYVAGVQLYNALSTAYTNPTADKNYYVTGVYAQYNTTKEVMPRSAEDVEEMKYQLNYILPASGTLSIKQNETLVSSGTKWVEGTEFTLSSTVPSDDYNAGVYTVTDWGEPANDVTADVLSGNTLTMPKYNVIVTVAFPEKAEATAISWSNSGAAVNVHIDNTDDLPTLTKGEFTVTCNSSDEDVATVDNDGVVTMVGAGTTTISAVFAGDDDYKAKTVSYELTVLPDFYITGTAVGGWDSDKVPVAGTSYTIKNLAAGSYKLKITIDGTWDTAKGFSDLTASEVIAGLYNDNDGNICFTLKAAGDVVVTYTGEVYKLAGDFEPQAVKVKGGWDSWTEHAMTLSDDKKSASVTVALPAAENVEFGIQINTDDFRANGYNYHRGYTGTAGITGNTGNMKLTSDIAGDYTFTWTFGTNAMNITFPLKEAGLSWGVDAATAYTVGKEYELPTLSNPNNLENVSYESSAPAVATIAADGTITLVGTGSTVITATSEATSVYKAGVATYTLTVSAPASVAVSGSCETDYEKGADFVRTGLVATAKYDDASELDVTASATWTNSLTDNKVNAAGDVTVTAEWQGLSGNKVVTVSLLTHELTFNAPTNGTLVVEYNDAEVATGDHFLKGDVLTITATADPGYKLTSLTVNEADFVSGNNYTVGTEDIAIVATFAAKTAAGLSWGVDAATAYTKGKSYELPTLSNPNGLMVELSSSNEAVAYLDEGQIKIAGAGTATITATSVETDVYAAGVASYTLNVLAPEAVVVTGDATKKAYEAGETFSFAGLGAKAVYAENDEYEIPVNEITWTPAEAPVINANGNVEVTATWEGLTSAVKNIAVTVNTHKVTIAAVENGTLVVKNGGVAIESGAEFAKGTELTVEVELESADYVLATLTANTTDIKATKQFTIGEVDVTIEATSELKPVAPISWSAESASIAMNGDVATLPTLVNELGLTIMYMSNNEEAATIDEASGEITLVGPGEATIRAIYVATPESQYRTTFAEYTLTVTAATYAVTFEAPTNGSLEILNGEDAVASGAEFVAGTELTITATADQGYKLSSLTVNGEDFVSGETYTMGAQAVVVVATFVQDSGTTIDNAEAGEKAQKIMLNNQLFILRGGKIYDAQGKLVK